MKEFKPSSWAINNRTTIFVLAVIITLGGLMAYRDLPKEKFPDIVIPTIYVSTVYPGTAPKDMENLVTRPIEKQVKAISGVKKLTSNSIQDFSNAIVEFSTDMDVSVARQKVRDAVDKAKKDLPPDLPADPAVMEIEFSEIPIMYINLSGDYDLGRLKKYAEALRDRTESLKEITRVDILGAPEREIQINADMYRLQSARLTMGDIERAVASENRIVSAGSLSMQGMRRSVSISGEFTSAEMLGNMVINSMSGAPVYLKDVAAIVDGYKEKESYARLNRKNVVTLNVVKRSGGNLIAASDKIRDIVDEMKGTVLPKDLRVSITGDQSAETRHTLNDLINTIIIGFILVTIILMFFMGAANAIFVGLSVPLSMCIAFMVLPGIGFTMNMIVLFAFLLGLGIVVDDAIVVIENTHRIFREGKLTITAAAKHAAGEVFLPVLSGTLTTLAPFVPLAFWKGVIGKFMHYMPVTLIITLTASLFVAYILNPVFAASFMRKEEEARSRPAFSRRMKKVTVVALAASVILHLAGLTGLGNLALTLLGLYHLHEWALAGYIRIFQERVWPHVQSRYAAFLGWSLQRPARVLPASVALLFLAVGVNMVRKPKVVFFPKAEPNFIHVYLELPVGTDPAYTDSLTRMAEERVYRVLGENNPIVESVISNVALGASEEPFDRGVQSHRGKVSVAFVEFAKRGGRSTAAYLDSLRPAVKDIPGAEITVNQERNGPPVSKPVNIEISGDNMDHLAATSVRLRHYLDSLQVPGVEELRSDFQDNNPGISVDIDRERANREGIFTGQAGMELRTALFGKEVSRFRDENDDYPIILRMAETQRSNIDALNQLAITYRDMNMGGAIRQVPLSAFAGVRYTDTYGGIKRKNQKRVITLSSNVLGGYNPNEVAASVAAAVREFEVPEGVKTALTGEQEEQKEAAGFLGRSLLVSLGLMLLILVMQFNSFTKPVIILTGVVFSIIGVLLGLAVFNMDISIVMTGVGVVALGGIVVRNGILLVEFTDHLLQEGYSLREAIVRAGMIRMTPVLLTASATILGMIPLAVGFNINFVTLFSELNPHIYFGGDSVAFWGPLSWTIIFGLGFATFLTLIVVPVLYLLSIALKEKMRNFFNPGTGSAIR